MAAHRRTLRESLPGLGRIVGHFWPLIRNQRLLIAGSFAALFTEVVLRVLEPWPLKFIFDHVLGARHANKAHGGAFLHGVEPGTLLLSRSGFHYAPRYPVQVIDRIGAGDSLVGGLIHGLLNGDFDLAIRLGGFCAAIGLATPGDINYLGPEDIARFDADRIGGLER